MTHWELTRLLCYTVAAPVLLYLALAMARNRLYAQACFYLAISLLFTWFLFEVTMIGAGVNTREMRFLATPFVVMAALSAVWMAANLAQWRLAERRRASGKDNGVLVLRKGK